MSEQVKEGRKVRQKKVQDIINKLEGTKALIINDYRGLTVSQIAEVRRGLQKNDAIMHIHKNKLAKIAMREKKYPEELLGYFTGPTAITYVKGDVSPALKTLFDFVKKEYPIKIRGLLTENKIFDNKQATMLAKLPSRNELIAQLMRTMNAPVENLARGFNDVIVRFVRVLQTVADTK